MFAEVQGPIAVDPEKHATFGLAGEPLVVTVPPPLGVEHVPSDFRKPEHEPLPKRAVMSL
jgi:hypothetical protein